MIETPEKPRFLAVLIYEDDAGNCHEEPRVYSASHPEIAYQLAFADGREQRFGRRFLGLSQFEETTEEIDPISRMQRKNAHELVVPKDDLLAFSDPRWTSTNWDETELADALREPPTLCDIEVLDSVSWYQYTHAYGTAIDVPKDIRRLASSDPQLREQAAWCLLGTIYHQGTLYSASVVAAPFLVQLAFDKRLTHRKEVLQVLVGLAESASFDPAGIAKTWDRRQNLFGHIYSKPCAELAQEEIADHLGVRRMLLPHRDAFQELASDADAETAKLAATIVKHLDNCKGSHVLPTT